MRILISSHRFYPDVGGIETVTELLAEEWIKEGHEVRIITQTPDSSSRELPVPVIRNPSILRLVRELLWCDVYFQNNISLQTLWPALILGKPTLITHQTWISPGIAGALKRFVCRLVAGTVAISEAIRKETGGDLVLPNPYQDMIFREDPRSERDRDLMFVGRLVSDKGADLVIQALVLLAQRGLKPGLTIVGEGPEAGFLRSLVSESSLENQIVFCGKKSGPELAALLRRHRMLIVPSRWEEPFGIVALEGIACGCVVIASSGGGLPESIGPCGLLFENGYPEMLADQLERLLGDPAEFEQLKNHPLRDRHLEHHKSTHIGKEYLKLFSGILGQGTSPKEPVLT